MKRFAQPGSAALPFRTTMNSLRLTFACAVVAVGSFVFACSSSTAKTATGGGKFFLTSAPSSVASNNCPDPTAQITISVKGTDCGSAPPPCDKLIVDGSDGATVTCHYDDSRFDITVGNAAGAIIASGTFSGNESKDAQIILRTASVTYKSDAPCDVVVEKGGDGLTGHFTCPTVINQSLAPHQCAVLQRDPGGTPLSFFKFTGCTGF